MSTGPQPLPASAPARDDQAMRVLTPHPEKAAGATVDHTAAARAALRAVLDSHGIDSQRAEVTLVTNGPVLTVTLHPGVELEPMVVGTASVRVLSAVRALDRSATIVDVTMSRNPPALA